MLQSVLLSALAGYLLGSIPSGAILARVYRNLDLTVQGSGRTGAANVLRTLGPGAAVIVLSADLAKGLLSVLLARVVTGGDSSWAELVAALGATLGHTYSPFLGFRGGRGVVTGIGATAAAQPLLMVAAVVAGGVVMATTRYVSLGSVVGAVVGGALMVAAGWLSANPAWVAWGVLLALLIIVSHRDNIRRLVTGTERKLGEPVGVA